MSVVLSKQGRHYPCCEHIPFTIYPEISGVTYPGSQAKGPLFIGVVPIVRYTPAHYRVSTAFFWPFFFGPSSLLVGISTNFESCFLTQLHVAEFEALVVSFPL